MLRNARKRLPLPARFGASSEHPGQPGQEKLHADQQGNIPVSALHLFSLAGLACQNSACLCFTAASPAVTSLVDNLHVQWEHPLLLLEQTFLGAGQRSSYAPSFRQGMNAGLCISPKPLLKGSCHMEPGPFGYDLQERPLRASLQLPYKQGGVLSGSFLLAGQARANQKGYHAAHLSSALDIISGRHAGICARINPSEANLTNQKVRLLPGLDSPPYPRATAFVCPQIKAARQVGYAAYT